MIVNRANLTILNTAFKAAFQAGLGQAPSQYQTLCTIVTSTTAIEEYGWLGEMHSLREWVGERVVHGVSEYGYTVKNKKFELTESVPRDRIEDDQYGIYTPLMTEMGRSTAAHPDQLAFGLLKDGRSALCYDKQPFFSAAHPVALPSGKLGTQSNIDDGAGGSGTWYVCDLTRSLKPMIFQNRKADNFVAKTADTDENVFHADAFLWGVDNRRNAGFGFWQMAQSSTKALDATNLKAAITALETRKGDHGRPLGLRASHLVVPSGLRFQAKELVLMQRNANGADNALNGELQILASPWLD